MLIPALLLALSASMMLPVMVAQTITGARRSPCLYYWGVIFFLLFVFVPLIYQIAYGPATSIRWDVEERLQSEQYYIIYGVLVLFSAFWYFLLAIPSLFRFSQSERSKTPKTLGLIRDDGAVMRQLLLGLLVVAGVFLYVAGTGLSVDQIIGGGRFAHYREGTIIRPFLALGLYLVSLVAVYAYYDVRRGFDIKLLSVAVYGAVIAMIMLTGGRKWLVFALSGFLAGYYRRYGKVPTGVLPIAGVGALVTLIFAWQFGRSVIWSSAGSFDAVVNDFFDRIPNLVLNGDLSYFYRASLEAIRENVSEGTFYPFALPLRIIFLPFPDEITFGLKPEGLPFLFAKDIGAINASRVGNVPPGLFGLFVLSFGAPVSIILAPLTLLGLVKAADWVVVNKYGLFSDVLFAYFVATSVLLMRGSEGSLYFLAFGALVVLPLGNLCKVLSRIPNRFRRFHDY